MLLDHVNDCAGQQSPVRPALSDVALSCLRVPVRDETGSSRARAYSREAPLPFERIDTHHLPHHSPQVWRSSYPVSRSTSHSVRDHGRTQVLLIRPTTYRPRIMHRRLGAVAYQAPRSNVPMPGRIIAADEHCAMWPLGP